MLMLAEFETSGITMSLSHHNFPIKLHTATTFQQK